MHFVVTVCQIDQPQIVTKNLLQIVHEIQIEHLFHFGIDFVFLHVIF
jgi:urease gamma subunit